MRTTTAGSEFPAAGQSPAELLQRWSGESSAEPALFFRVGWDWRWWPIGRVCDEVERLRVEAPDAESGGELPELRALTRRLLDGTLATGSFTRAASLDARLSPLVSKRGFASWLGVRTPEVLVAVLSEADCSDVLIAWWLARRAALVLPPSPRAWLEAVLFARPTRVWGGEPELLALSVQLERWSPRRRARRLDRLQSFVLLSPLDQRPPAAGVLAEQGIEVLSVPAETEA